MPLGQNIDEKVWERAKKAFKESYKKEPSEDRDYAILMTIYKKMKGEGDKVTEKSIIIGKLSLLKSVASIKEEKGITTQETKRASQPMLKILLGSKKEQPHPKDTKAFSLKAMPSVSQLSPDFSPPQRSAFSQFINPNPKPTTVQIKAIPEAPAENKPLPTGAHRTPPKDYPEDKELYAIPSEYKYPLDTAERVRSAITYFSRYQTQYSPEERKSIWGRIIKQAKKFGIEGSEDVKKRAEKSITRFIKLRDIGDIK